MLARMLRDLAREERGSRTQHLLAWAWFVESLPAEHPHVQAIARAPSTLRSLAEHPPSEALLARFAEAGPEWTVEVELLTEGNPLTWPPPWESIRGFGVGEWENGARLSATLAIPAADEQEAERIADSLLDAYLAQTDIHARRVTSG